MINRRFSRRALLRGVAGGVAATAQTAATARPSVAACPQGRPTDPAQFKAQVRGAILSIPTPFTGSLDVDYDGVRTMIRRALPHDIRIFSLTSGNSQYASLKHDEILELTRVMVEAAGDEGLTIAATDLWDEPKTIEYARFAESVGASAVQIIRPETDDDELVFQFFKNVAPQTELPIVLHGNFSMPLLEKLVTIESIVALKEDVGLEYYVQVQRKFGDRLAVFEGGPEYAYLVAYPYGSPASYTTLGTFAPQLTQQFWQALERKDLGAAYDMVIKYEHPFFDRWSHAFWRASLEHFGVADRYLRPPQESFNDEQMREVAKFYSDIGLS